MTAKTSPHIFSALLLATAAALPAAAALAEPAPAGGKLETCLRAVNILGASMGHTEIKDAQGRPFFRFRLRTSGMDYDVTCDAQSGIVNDVTPHRAGDAAPL